MIRSAQQALALAFIDSAARLERRLDGALAHARGISFSEYRMLLALSRLHGGSAMRVELAAAVGLTPSAVTRALRPLEKLGYVATLKSDRDARRSLARLTAAGQQLVEEAGAVVDDMVADLPLARTFGETEPEAALEGLADLLARPTR